LQFANSLLAVERVAVAADGSRPFADHLARPLAHRGALSAAGYRHLGDQFAVAAVAAKPLRNRGGRSIVSLKLGDR
jgi:hypothetical protein